MSVKMLERIDIGSIYRLMNEREAATLEELDRLIALLEERQKGLTALFQRLSAKAEPQNGIRYNRFEHQEQDDARIDAHLVMLGVSPEDGSRNPEVAAQVGQMGLFDVERALLMLRKRRDEAVAQSSTTWPRNFRYIGMFGKTEIGGRVVRPGEIVQLDESRAWALRDRFEEVREEPKTETEEPEKTPA